MHIGDYLSLATLLGILGLYGKLYLMNYQFKLMWRDYCKRHGLPWNGHEHTKIIAE